MNRGRAVVAGFVQDIAGFVQNIANFVMHGIVPGGVPPGQPAFVQASENMAMQGRTPGQSEPRFQGAGPGVGGIVSMAVWLLVIALVPGVAASVLFASSRQSWKAGASDGLHVGILLGVVVGFQHCGAPHEGGPRHPSRIHFRSDRDTATEPLLPGAGDQRLPVPRR